MTVGIWPFWSQQDKIDGVFRLDTCGNAKQLAFLANTLSDAGVGNFAAVPYNSIGINPFAGYRYVSLPLENAVQRIHWNTGELRMFFKNCTVAVLNNEYMAIPMRALFPKLRIIQMCPVPVDSGLFKHAFDAADLVVARSELQAKKLRSYTHTPVGVWPMYYDERPFNTAYWSSRTTDVLFLPRCSANNATHHEEFLAAIADSDWRVAFTDITRWLRTQRPELRYTTPETYVSELHKARVVVSLYESWNGEMGLYEALRAGCVPVVCYTASTAALLGKTYPYMVHDLNQLRNVIEAALRYSGSGHVVPLNIIKAGSYQVGAARAVEDVCRS